ncbi:hypothetical protein K1719_025593 [Acacia pycnantha]|nr:hypothetical protein K1719_025593 [Acacia pycnantha]
MALSGKDTFVHAPTSSEEDDLLVRSSKKVKNGLEEWPKLGDSSEKFWSKGQSFAERLQGINPKPLSKGSSLIKDASSDDIEADDSLMDSDNDDCSPLCVIQEDPERNFPSFTFSEKMKKRLYKAWDKADIIKLLGKSVGYKMLLTIIQSLWAKRGVINLINIGNDFFVVKFTNKEDYLNALTGESHGAAIVNPEQGVEVNKEKAGMISEDPRGQNSEGTMGNSRAKVPTSLGDVGGRVEQSFSFVASGSREKKGGTKKKQGKAQSMSAANSGKGLDGQVQRKEKRAREMVRKESKGGDIPRLTYEKSKPAGYYLKEPLTEGKIEVHREEEPGTGSVVGPEDDDDNLELEDVGNLILDQGDGPRLEGLEGRFWNGPVCGEPSKAELGEEMGEDPEVSCVPETQ